MRDVNACLSTSMEIDFCPWGCVPLKTTIERVHDDCFSLVAKQPPLLPTPPNGRRERARWCLILISLSRELINVYCMSFRNRLPRLVSPFYFCGVVILDHAACISPLKSGLKLDAPWPRIFLGDPRYVLCRDKVCSGVCRNMVNSAVGVVNPRSQNMGGFDHNFSVDRT